MPLMIDAKIKPSGNFPAADAEDILMPDGSRLSERPRFIPVTKEEYDALVEAGTVNENDLYLIREG